MYGEGGNPRDSFSTRAQRDLSFLGPALFLPLHELHNFDVRKHRSLIALAAIGLAPLAIFDFVGHGLDIAGAFSCLALYFSAFWFACFYLFFRGEETMNGRIIAACYFGVLILSVAVYLPLTTIPPLSIGQQLLQTNWITPIRIVLDIAVVGLPEELFKAAALFIIWRTRHTVSPRTMLFYGLICGLGFGIREGILYQTNYNAVNAQGDLALYYLTNILRITSLPFLHAIWTGIAGYFIGFAGQFRHRQTGLIIVAIGLPAILHGAYDALSDKIIGLGVAIISVLLLGLYLNTSEYFAATLSSEHPALSTRL